MHPKKNELLHEPAVIISISHTFYSAPNPTEDFTILSKSLGCILFYLRNLTWLTITWYLRQSIE